MFRIISDDAVAHAEALFAQHFRQLETAADPIQFRRQGTVVDDYRRLVSEAEGLVAPIRPTGQGLGFPGIVWPAISVIHQFDLQVHGGTQGHVGRGCAGVGFVDDPLVDFECVQFVIVDGDAGITFLKGAYQVSDAVEVGGTVDDERLGRRSEGWEADQFRNRRRYPRHHEHARQENESEPSCNAHVMPPHRRELGIRLRPANRPREHRQELLWPRAGWRFRARSPTPGHSPRRASSAA